MRAVETGRDWDGWKLTAAQYGNVIVKSFFTANWKHLDHLGYNILHILVIKFKFLLSTITTPNGQNCLARESFLAFQRFVIETFLAEKVFWDENSRTLWNCIANSGCTSVD